MFLVQHSESKHQKWQKLCCFRLSAGAVMSTPPSAPKGAAEGGRTLVHRLGVLLTVISHAAGAVAVADASTDGWEPEAVAALLTAVARRADA